MALKFMLTFILIVSAFQTRWAYKEDEKVYAFGLSAIFGVIYTFIIFWICS